VRFLTEQKHWCCILSFWVIPGVLIFCADVSEHTSIFIGGISRNGQCSETSTHKFRRRGITRKNNTSFRTRRNSENKKNNVQRRIVVLYFGTHEKIRNHSYPSERRKTAYNVCEYMSKEKVEWKWCTASKNTSIILRDATPISTWLYPEIMSSNIFSKKKNKIKLLLC